jgi:L-2-hydroxyglutarate oxidase LhgO
MDDFVIVGGGLLGLATARELLGRRPQSAVTVIEKEALLGQHQSGHNSGVIHSGLYYPPGSLKAKLCVEGAGELFHYCAQQGIEVERCGKLVVATDVSELGRLGALYRRGLANGVIGLERVGPARMRELEPNAHGMQGLWCPATGIVDYRDVLAAYAQDILRGGGTILTSTAFQSVHVQRQGLVVETTCGDLSTRTLISCAGLQSDRVAAAAQGAQEPQIVPFRGSYWQLRPDARHLVKNLIYPVPDPRLPFLGIHATRRIKTGEIWLGPNAVLAAAREGYRMGNVNRRDVLEALGSRGLHRMVGRHWRVAAREVWRDVSKRSFLKAVQRYIPDITARDLVPGPSGVRAQAIDRNGHLIDDFVIDQPCAGILHVRNAPSPAATASLPIARFVAKLALATAA